MGVPTGYVLQKIRVGAPDSKEHTDDKDTQR